MADEYWEDKRKVANIFDQPDAPSPNRAVSARSRNTSTLTRPAQSFSSPSEPPSLAPRHSIAGSSVTPKQPLTPSSVTLPRRPIAEASTTPRSTSSTTLSSSHAPTVSHSKAIDRIRVDDGLCRGCNKKIEANLLTEFEGNMSFCRTACRLETIKSIARDLVHGRTERMYQLKSVESKCFLLDETVKRGTSDAIIRAAVYMSNTCRGVFNRELKNRPDAFRHYVSYLKQMGNYEEAADLLDANCSFDEAGLLRMTRVPTDLRSEETQNRLLNLNIPDELMNSLIQQNVDLAQCHGDLEPTCRKYHDLANLRSTNPDCPAAINAPEWLSLVPAPKTLFGVPLMSTLLFIIVYDQHYQGKLNANKVRNIFKVNDRHFAWVCVQALSLLLKWSDLESAVLQKSLLRSDKSTLPPERVARYVHNAIVDSGEYSQEVRACISRFLKIIADVDERFEAALKFNAWEVAVNVCVQLKDRDRMMHLNRSLTPGSHPWGVTKKYLELPPNKWRSL